MKAKVVKWDDVHALSLDQGELACLHCDGHGLVFDEGPLSRHCQACDATGVVETDCELGVNCGRCGEFLPLPCTMGELIEWRECHASGCRS